MFGPNFGNVPPGGACTKPTDCEPGDGGVMPSCYGLTEMSTGTITPGTCIQLRKGKAGDQPCWEQYDGPLFEGTTAPAPAPTQGVVCDVRDGVWCDFATHVCEPVKNPGDACDTTNVPQCGIEATCISDVCTPRAPAGARCDDVTENCGDYLRCDEATSTCVPVTPRGSPCASSGQCLGECVDGVCISSAESYLCGG